MTAIEGFPLPVTAKHDEGGNHVPPYIKEWRHNPGHHAVLGSQVETNERRQRVFHEHLEEHRRRGEPAIVVEDI